MYSMQSVNYEEVKQFQFQIQATYPGVPPLSSKVTVNVFIVDENDNSPVNLPPYSDHGSVNSENIPYSAEADKLEPAMNTTHPDGSWSYSKSTQQYDTIYSVSEEVDKGTAVGNIAKDLNLNNAQVAYSMLETSNNIPLSMMININSLTGEIYSMQSFNFEEVKKFQFQVQATDFGVPPLNSNVTVNVFILDDNDNSPVLLPPYSDHGSVHSENIPYSAEAGYFVAKIRAVDADSGYNGLLSYHIAEPKGTNLFRIGTSNGEIRTKRRMSDNDLKTHLLVILVSDNGEPSLSVTVSIDVVVFESTGDMQTTFRQLPVKEERFSDLNLYLLIAIVSISVIFILSLISLIAVKCHRTDGRFSRYSAPMITTHPNGSWSYSKSTQQYEVGFSSDTLKSDVVVFPTPFPPADGELISIDGGDTFQRTRTLPNTEKIVYYVSEEVNKRTVIGNIAKDLNLNFQELELYFVVNLKTGVLLVNERIDLEELCETNQKCSLNVQAIAHNPLNIFRVEIETLDINDNEPNFLVNSLALNVYENAAAGERFLLPVAEDADVGRCGHTGDMQTTFRQLPVKEESISDLNLYLLLAIVSVAVIFILSLISLIAVKCHRYGIVMFQIVSASKKSNVDENLKTGIFFMKEPLLFLVQVLPRFIFLMLMITHNVLQTVPLMCMSRKRTRWNANVHCVRTLMNMPRYRILSWITTQRELQVLILSISFNYEEFKTFEFQVQATDSGVPPLSSNVTGNIFILDENDNCPVNLPPYSDHGSVISENIPYSAEAGYFVAKIRAVDADSGYNGLLSYHISEPKGTNLFRIGTSNGEIRTKSDNDLSYNSPVGHSGI
ncbi:unnamed protein product [Coregonus sp. 'balchen']|nr:unnamed protein product [Coregonus sp. 'balchen']